MNIFGTSGKATDFFAPPSYREGQQEMIEKIEAAFDSEKKFVILQGPTGSGKSQIARAFAFQADSAYVLTPQKILQDQYERDFPEMQVIKGRSAYPCLVKGIRTCEKGACRTSKNIRHEDCPYRDAKEAGQRAPVTIYNFDSFFYQNLSLKAEERKERKRKLMILDECHNLENKYLGFMSLEISNKNQDLYLRKCKKIEEYDELLFNHLSACSSRIAELEAKFKREEELAEEEADELEDLRKLQYKLEIYVNNRTRPDPIEYIFKFEDKHHYQKVVFEPIFVDQFIGWNLFPYGERFLMMSATILDFPIFCEKIGLDPRGVVFFQQDSNFPTENRPIVKMYVGKMSRDHIDATLPKILDAIGEILKGHPNQKGIIQTHSEKIATYIKQNLHDPRLTFNKDHETAKKTLETHEQKPASFLVASGLREGIDLKGDLSEVQVFCKVPYPDLGDKRIRRRNVLKPRWYNYETALMFIQSLGRSIRSEKEMAITYILDRCFESFYLNNRKFFPSYIRETIEKAQRLQPCSAPDVKS